MLIWFTNIYNKQVAIDNQHVVSVYETGSNTCVETIHGSIQLKEPILDVVARLNTSN